MTIQHVIDFFVQREWWILGYFAFLIVFAFILSLTPSAANVDNLKYLMAVIVYAVSVPGVFAVILLVYSVFVLGSSVLTLSMIVYFLPIVSMIICLWQLSRKVYMKDIPGFNKLSGLLVLIGLTIVILLILQRTHFGVIFLGSMTHLLIGFVCVFIIFRFALHRIRK